MQNYGYGVTCKSRNDSKTAASPNLTPAWVTAHDLGPWSTLHSLQATQPLGALVGLKVLFAHWLLLFTPTGRSPMNLFSFRDCRLGDVIPD